MESTKKFNIFPVLWKKDKPYKSGMFANSIEEMNLLNSMIHPASDGSEIIFELIKADNTFYHLGIVLKGGGILDIDDCDIFFNDDFDSSNIDDECLDDISKSSHVTLYTMIMNDYELKFGSIYGIPADEIILAYRYKKDSDIQLNTNSNLSQEEYDFLTNK